MVPPRVYHTRHDNQAYTLAVGLIMFKSNYGATLYLGPMMAVSLVSILPVMILYLVAQKYSCRAL